MNPILLRGLDSQTGRGGDEGQAVADCPANQGPDGPVGGVGHAGGPAVCCQGCRSSSATTADPTPAATATQLDLSDSCPALDNSAVTSVSGC